jgi:hypothetical protein
MVLWAEPVAISQCTGSWLAKYPDFSEHDQQSTDTVNQNLLYAARGLDLRPVPGRVNGLGSSQTVTFFPILPHTAPCWHLASLPHTRAGCFQFKRLHCIRHEAA